MDQSISILKDADKAGLKLKYINHDEYNREQIQYCISQMKRFALCMKANANTMRKYQFFYQIGRIQELLGSSPKIW